MQSQERELIAGLFGRLQPFESQPRDSEAEALIKDLVARQPAAPYLLAQAVLVQEQALQAAQERIAELEAKAGTGQIGAAPGFLGNASRLGPWGAGGGPSTSTAATGQALAPRASVPSTRSPLQAAVSQQAAGGGFLRTAMATAAGVAGGALLFEGIRNLLAGNPGPLGNQQAATPTPPESTPSELLPPEAAQQQQADNQASEAEPVEDYDAAAYDADMGEDDDSWA